MKTSILAAVAVVALAAAPPAMAPAAQPKDESLQISLGYDGRLLVKVLDMQVEQHATAHGFGSSARLVSTGVLRLLKNVDERASSQGRISGGDVRPGTFEYQHLSSKTKRKVKVVWGPGDVEMTATVPFSSLGDPPASREQKLAAVDPLTGLMEMTLSGPRAGLCRRSYSFFDGKQLYALDFSNQRPGSPTDTEKRLGLTGPFSCDVRFREVAGFKPKPPEKRNQGLQKPIEVDFAQVGAAGPLVISRLRAATPLGRATIELKRLTVSGKDPTG